MNVSVIEELFEQHIKPLPPSARLRLIEMIARNTVLAPAPKKKEHSLLDLEGLGAEIWSDIATDAYLDSLRSEWDDQV